MGSQPPGPHVASQDGIRVHHNASQTDPANRRYQHVGAIVTGKDAPTSCQQSQHEGRPQRQPSWPPGTNLWREIAIGLAVAAIGLVLVLCVIGTGATQPRTAQHAAGPTLALHNDPAAPVVN
jgi:hypothetical protein